MYQKARGHEMVLHTRAKDFLGLAEHTRDLVQAGDIVLVLLHRRDSTEELSSREAPPAFAKQQTEPRRTSIPLRIR
jgi:hypothetical protein